MRNSQLKPGYNIQFGVEGEYIVGVDVSSERNDQNALIPLLEQMEEQLGTKYQDVTADAGYESEENYSYLEEHGQRAMIKPNNYEISRTRKYKRDISRREKRGGPPCFVFVGNNDERISLRKMRTQHFRNESGERAARKPVYDERERMLRL
jgi:hypothetical protein